MVEILDSRPAQFAATSKFCSRLISKHNRESVRRVTQWIISQVGVPRGGLWLCVPQKLTHNRQRLGAGVQVAQLIRSIVMAILQDAIASKKSKDLGQSLAADTREGDVADAVHTLKLTALAIRYRRPRC